MSSRYFSSRWSLLSPAISRRGCGRRPWSRGERAKATEDLYLFSRKLAAVFSLDDLLWATAFQFAQMLKVRVVILLPDGETVAVRAGYPPEDMLEDADIAAAKWVWDHGTEAGRGSNTLPGAKWLFMPMRTGRGTVGVVGLDSDKPGALLSPDQRRLFDALADQAALAIERINLADDIDRNRLNAETERLRSALLTSISHDLRTPLSSILGSASSLKNYGATLGEAAKQELLGAILEEAERPQPLHRQSTRYDTAGIGRYRTTAGTGRSRRSGGKCAAARRQGSGRITKSIFRYRPIC